MSSFAVIFDVDGTLVDNHAYHEEAWLEWARRHGRPLDTAFYREHLYARSNDRILRTLMGDGVTPEEVARFASEKEGIYRDLYAPHVRPMPGLLDLLRDLQRHGTPCAAASNAERINVDFIIDGLALRGFFRAVLAREDVAHGKPDPELFERAAARMGCDTARCLVFEDSSAGFEAAARAGMTCLAIAGHSREGAVPPHVRARAADFSTWGHGRLAAFMGDGAR